MSDRSQVSGASAPLPENDKALSVWDSVPPAKRCEIIAAKPLNAMMTKAFGSPTQSVTVTAAEIRDMREAMLDGLRTALSRGPEPSREVERIMEMVRELEIATQDVDTALELRTGARSRLTRERRDKDIDDTKRARDRARDRIREALLSLAVQPHGLAPEPTDVLAEDGIVNAVALVCCPPECSEGRDRRPCIWHWREANNAVRAVRAAIARLKEKGAK